MDEKIIKLIENMTPEQRQEFARAASEQLMLVSREFRVSRNLLAEIAGMSQTYIDEMSDQIGTIEQSALNSAEAEYNLMTASGIKRVLH